MAQVNINERRGPAHDYDDEVSVNTPVPDAGTPTYGDGHARAAATNNLTWAIAVVLIIAAIAIAIVFLAHNLHF